MGHCQLVERVLVTILIVFWLIIILKCNRDVKNKKESKTRGFQDAVDSMSQEEREELLKVLSEIDEKGRYGKKRAIIEKKIREDKARRDRHCESPAQSHSNMNLHTQADVSDYRSPSRSNDGSDSSSSSSSDSGSSSSD